ncbi:MAG: helix-turn-helix transcriptional regulator [Armatimonadetes bacterium]|nr:helix-turn-helix transcriptional regulator [Armatimonadota bacterium]
MIAAFKFYIHPHYWLVAGNPEKLVPLPRSLEGLVGYVHRLRMKEEGFERQIVGAAATLCLARVLGQRDVRRVEEHSDPWVRRVRMVFELVSQNPGKDWLVSELASRCNATADYFSRRFARLVGVSPIQFLLEEKMRYAALLLTERQSPPKAVAFECGYSSVHAFGRAFKKVFGVGPATYAHHSLVAGSP